MSQTAIYPDMGEHPPATIPTVFADGVTNLAHGSGITKFYLARVDPAVWGGGPPKTQAFAQVIMPEMAFLQTYAFFEKEIARLVATGVIDLKNLEMARQMVMTPAASPQ